MTAIAGRRVAIVGAGVLGLAAGRVLARRGIAVDLYERWPDVAGMASAFDLGNGVWLDRYYHHLFQSDREMISLHEELVPGDLEWHRSSVGMYADGRIWPFVTPLDLLRYGPLALPDRMRLGVATLALTRRSDWQRMDDISALDWLQRACGERAVAKVWRPLLLGKFGDLKLTARFVVFSCEGPAQMRSGIIIHKNLCSGRQFVLFKKDTQ